MNHQTRQKLKLTHPVVLLSEHYYRRLWLATKNSDVPRRVWLDELANTFRDFNGEILTPDGQPYDLPFIDDVFGDDYEMRWMGYYLKPDVSGVYPKSKTRKVERLQLIDLYFRLKHPQIARHFSK